MAADEHLHGQQFGGRTDLSSGQYPLFMTADELADPEVFQHGDVDASLPGDQAEVERDKLADAKTRLYPWLPADPEYGTEGGMTLYDSIKQSGVRQPVRVEPPGREKRWYEPEGTDTSRPQVVNGHHRVFAAADIQKQTGRTQWVPVEWTDETDY